MPRPSPQTDRVVAVLNLLAADGDAGRTMTEIARHLRIHQASCIHMLAALTRAGYLVREPRQRRYHLGPALIRPGEVAARHFQGLEIARAEMDELTRTLGLACLAFAPEDGHARLVAYTWDPRRPVPSLSVGELLPIPPPLGSVFVAWAAAGAVQEWLRRSPEALAAAETYERLLADIRGRGYVVEFRTPTSFLREMTHLDHSPSMREAIERLLEAGGSQSEMLLTRFDPASRYRVGSISTPVFDLHGNVCLALDIADFPNLMTGAEIEHVATLTRAAADRVSAALGGRRPRSRAPRPGRRRPATRGSAPRSAPSTRGE